MLLPGIARECGRALYILLLEFTILTLLARFHGYAEVLGDRYQLCARDLDAQLPHMKWLEFERCQNGVGGAVGIAGIPQNS